MNRLWILPTVQQFFHFADFMYGNWYANLNAQKNPLKKKPIVFSVFYLKPGRAITNLLTDVVLINKYKLVSHKTHAKRPF